jgi:hypothetical protein
VATTTPGQNGVVTFSGTANQRVSLLGTYGLSGQILACDIYVRVLKPDATTLVGPTCVEGWGFIEATTLATSGTYTIVVDPASVLVGGVTLALYDVVDVSGTLTVGGGSMGVTIGAPGQNAALTFGGTQSQAITVRVTSNTVYLLTVSVLKPDGTTIAQTISTSASFNLAVPSLPETATYTVRIDPYQASTGSLNVSVTSP